MPKKPETIVVDELCTCGHLKSSHGSSVNGYAPGHGSCLICGCQKFTWKKFLTAGELAYCFRDKLNVSDL